MTPDLLPELLFGPYDGTLGPFGCDANSRLRLPSCPDMAAESKAFAVYVWVEARTAWMFLNYQPVRSKAEAK